LASEDVPMSDQEEQGVGSGGDNADAC